MSTPTKSKVLFRCCGQEGFGARAIIKSIAGFNRVAKCPRCGVDQVIECLPDPRVLSIKVESPSRSIVTLRTPGDVPRVGDTFLRFISGGRIVWQQQIHTGEFHNILREEDEKALEARFDSLRRVTLTTRFTQDEVNAARAYWSALSQSDLIFFWKHYTTGAGVGTYDLVDRDTTYLDYLCLSARESALDQVHDC